MPKPSIEVEIGLRDRLTAALAGVRGRVGALAGKLGTLDSGLRGINSRLLDLGKSTAIWGAGLAAVGAGAGLAMMEHSISTAAALEDFAEKTGMSAESIQRWRFAAEEAGVAPEILDGALQKLNLSMGKMRANTGPLTKELAHISPALAKQIKAAKSTEEAMMIALGAISKLTDKSGKLADRQRGAALAALFFGKANTDMAALSRRGLDDLKSSFDAVNKSGILTSDQVATLGQADDAIGRAKLAARGLANQLTAQLAPALTDATTKVTAWLNEHRGEIVESVTGKLKAMGRWLRDLPWQRIGDEIKGAWAALVKVGEWIGADGAKTLAWTWAAATAVSSLSSVVAGLAPLLGAAAAPIAAVLGGFAVGVALALAIWKYWDDIGRAIGRAAEKLDVFGIMDQGPATTEAVYDPATAARNQVRAAAAAGNELAVQHLAARGQVDVRITTDAGSTATVTRSSGDVRPTVAPSGDVGRRSTGIGGAARRGDL